MDSTSIRRVALLLVCAAVWVTPYLVPIDPIFQSAPPEAPVGWYAAFGIDLVWTFLVVASVMDELPRLERRWQAPSALPWLLASVAGGVMIVVYEVVSSTPRRNPEFAASAGIYSPLAMQLTALVQAGVALAVPAIVVLVCRAFARPIELGRCPLRRWVALVALISVPMSPALLFARLSQLVLFTIASWMICLDELWRYEARRPHRKWPARLLAFAIGAPLALGEFFIGGETWLRDQLTMLQYAGAGLAVAAVCLSSADAVAWALRRSRSIRARMLALALCTALVALGSTAIDVPVRARLADGSTPPVLNPVLTLVADLAILVVMISAFSLTLSKRLSQTLERSLIALSEVRRGNLDVSLDDTGRDELAQVSRSFNQMVAMRSSHARRRARRAGSGRAARARRAPCRCHSLRESSRSNRSVRPDRAARRGR
jgi:HAMP domain-containing protein